MWERHSLFLLAAVKTLCLQWFAERWRSAHARSAHTQTSCTLQHFCLLADYLFPFLHATPQRKSVPRKYKGANSDNQHKHQGWNRNKKLVFFIMPNHSKNNQIWFQLCFHMGLEQHGIITNHSRPGIQDMVRKPCWTDGLHVCAFCCVATTEAFVLH